MRISFANNKFSLKFKTSNSNTVENNRLREKRLNITEYSKLSISIATLVLVLIQ